jgi:hypothetical protein
MKRKMVNALRTERQQLEDRLGKIKNMIDALGDGDHRPGPRKGRKLSKAHVAKIRAGIRRARAAKAKAQKTE